MHLLFVVCMYILVYVSTYMHICFQYTDDTYVYVYICLSTYVLIYVCMSVDISSARIIYVYTYIHMSAQMHVLCLSMYARIHSTFKKLR